MGHGTGSSFNEHNSLVGLPTWIGIHQSESVSTGSADKLPELYIQYIVGFQHFDNFRNGGQIHTQFQIRSSATDNSKLSWGTHEQSAYRGNVLRWKITALEMEKRPRCRCPHCGIVRDGPVQADVNERFPVKAKRPPLMSQPPTFICISLRWLRRVYWSATCQNTSTAAIMSQLDPTTPIMAISAIFFFHHKSGAGCNLSANHKTRPISHGTYAHITKQNLNLELCGGQVVVSAQPCAQYL